jgi:bacterioferritin-associated ferredoxin
VIVCVCHAVSDRAIRDAAAGGASLDDVARATRAGTSCGCCKETVKALLGTAAPCKPDAPCAGCPKARAAA